VLRNLLNIVRRLWTPPPPEAELAAAEAPEPPTQSPASEPPPRPPGLKAGGPEEAAAAEPPPQDAPVQATGELRGQVVEALRTVYDPEIPVDIYELGLIYEVAIDSSGQVDIQMTLTSPGCPVAGILPGQVEEAARGVQGVREARVELVWDPPWGPDRMSDAAKLELGML